MRNYIFRYQRNLFDKKFNPKDNTYYQEVWIMPPDELLLKTKVYNELIFAKRLYPLVNQEILINDGSDDPYGMILFSQEGVFHLEEDGTYEGPGIRIMLSTKHRLSYEKLLQLFPGKDELLFGKEPKTIPSTLLESCIID